MPVPSPCSSFPLSCHPQKLRAYSLREPRLTNNTSDQKANEEIQFLTCWTSTCGEADAGMPGCRTPIRSKGKQQIGAVFYRIRSIETQTGVIKDRRSLMEPGIFRTGAESCAKQLIVVFRSAAHSGFGGCGFVYYRWRLHCNWHKCCDDSTFTRSEAPAGFEFAKWTIAGPGWISPRSTMSTSTTCWASSISHHLRATKQILQDTIFDAKYVRSREIRRVGGLTFAVAALRRPSTMLRLD
jgi:hypothetical protein